MVHTCSVKGKNRLDFGFHPRENAILPRFLLMKGKNCAILGFQLRENYFPSVKTCRHPQSGRFYG